MTFRTLLLNFSVHSSPFHNSICIHSAISEISVLALFNNRHENRTLGGRFFCWYSDRNISRDISISPPKRGQPVPIDLILGTIQACCTTFLDQHFFVSHIVYFGFELLFCFLSLYSQNYIISNLRSSYFLKVRFILTLIIGI